MSHINSGKKIFMTGGTGFFGKSILDMICRGRFADMDFTILSRNPQKFLEQYPLFSQLTNVSFMAGDIRDFTFPTPHFDFIFHAAAPVVENLRPGEIRDTIMRGNERILALAKHCGAEKILLTSSGAVYGPQPSAMMNLSEEYPCQPATEYGIAKFDAENMLKASGIHTCIARCFAFAGPRLPRNAHFAIGNFIGDCLAGRDIIIKGDGTPYRSYLYADDLAEWLFTILEKGENGRPYNVGSDEAVSIYDLAVKVREVIGSHNEIKVLTPKDPSVLPSRYVPCIERITRELNCEIKYNLLQTVKASIY